MTTVQLNRARRLLCELQDQIRDTVLDARAVDGASFSDVVGVTAADTQYRVDRVSEDAIVEWFERNWPKTWSVEVVSEGFEGGSITFPRGTPVAKTLWKCIIDPIDGTRGLMYDKRPAWSLAALAPQIGPKTNLRDIVVAAMTEIPTTKQWRADQISVVRGEGVIAEMVDVTAGSHETGLRPRFEPRPSGAHDFKHGFSSFARFFPEGKGLLGAVEEQFWAQLHGTAGADQPMVFDDQYISTGGQLYEIMVGHDRMVADLRPLALRRLGVARALWCHPYDICTALVLTELGGIVEKPMGGALDAPLDTTTPISWVSYANPQLAKLARPVLRKLIKLKL